MAPAEFRKFLHKPYLLVSDGLKKFYEDFCSVFCKV